MTEDEFLALQNGDLVRYSGGKSDLEEILEYPDDHYDIRGAHNDRRYIWLVGYGRFYFSVDPNVPNAFIYFEKVETFTLDWSEIEELFDEWI